MGSVRTPPGPVSSRPSRVHHSGGTLRSLSRFVHGLSHPHVSVSPLRPSPCYSPSPHPTYLPICSSLEVFYLLKGRRRCGGGVTPLSDPPLLSQFKFELLERNACFEESLRLSLSHWNAWPEETPWVKCFSDSNSNALPGRREGWRFRRNVLPFMRDSTFPSRPVPSRPVPSHPVPSRPVPSHPVPSRPVPSRPIPSTPVPSRPVPSHLIPSRPIPFHLVPIPSHPVRPIPSHPIPSAPIPSHPMASRYSGCLPGLASPADDAQ